MATDRRRLLLMLAAGAAGALGLSGSSVRSGRFAQISPGAVDGPPAPDPFAGAAPAAGYQPGPAAHSLPPVPAGRPGRPVLVDRLPAGSGQRIALTIDDGYAPEVVSAYAQFARSAAIPLTFSPNGSYAAAWNPQAKILAPLVEAGSVQIINHTFSHRDMRGLPDAAIRSELERNEDWVVRTFGITTRPWYRPPFGFHNARSDGLAGQLGWTRIALWNGTLGDATPLTPEALMANARSWLRPGTLMLGHANHPTVTRLYGQLVELIRERQLTPVTLDTAFGTSRATGV